ncbi:MAG: hypothetical protein A3C85_01065 [Candidatus Doudnabacteria bacterium RIFCSPHIGHO2_02_FULL_48_21]|nr:MAG: hypothetical protein A3K05_04115 [Candidatus Doudnabacteria bacterium RIFCSPHIGHO2_01_48_18]OGE77240.1 MAG: hypothetical protein A2668_03090 [Candidatus Doudnabacteria bacterium RIFCSPHIGHO2_01_FULL_48_180]OGE91078.1 MAG: hypothetical protein A3F44_02005 [Candidatus Doudnabacteria bacterium RIFCSPHIGHO2_12_FULL_47_25]OGE93768.1 MAG: hypothetical protein A3C85_01065 [Candidatus Doudnabacteria bacterium RIFCSPHIGHO2_02_FULL_48_21]OGE97163.1 MAG: hypothetical protein A3A83_01015 [Candidatu
MLASNVPETTQSTSEPPKGYKKFLAGIALVLVFFAGWQFGQSGRDIKIGNFKIFESNREDAPKEVDWNILWRTIELMEDRYVNDGIDLEKVLHGAVQGAVSALGDPYSVFLPPKEAQDFKNELSGNIDGIGAEIGIKHQRLTVIAPLDGSPALRAGLRGGDYIYKVDDQETTNLTVEEAVGKIRGPAGSQVKLTIFHVGDTKPVDVVITRARIEIKSVETEVRNVNGKKIGIIKLRRFGEDTTGGVRNAVSSFLVQGVNGVILDMRNNPGGFLDTAVDVAGFWIKDGETVLIQKFGDGSEDIFRAEGQGRLNGVSTVVLMNGGSASASEIVAGALKDHDLARLIGEKSFGKGSVQELIDLDGKAQLKLTIAKWLTPKGHDLNKEGLEPDIKVELSEEDFQNDRDPQMERALEELTR